MLKNLTGKIESCVVKKQGITNNKPWTIYSVIIGGQEFSSFDSAWGKNIGKEGTWEYEEKPSKDGQYINRTLSRYPEVKVQTNAGDDTSIVPDNIIRGLGILRGDIKKLKEDIEGSLEAINGLLQTINAKISPSGMVKETSPLPDQPPIFIDDDEVPVIE